VSYIYEALKRAEDENKRGAVAVRAAGRRTLFGGRPRWWVWALIGVLGANVVVLATLVVTLDSRSPATPAVAREQREASVSAKPGSVTTPQAAAVARVVEPATLPQPVAPVAPATRGEPATPRMDRQPPAIVSPRKIEARVDQDVPTRRPPVSSAKVPNPEDAAVAEPSQPVEAPKITLQVIVYSDVPSQRMVFIDGRRYAEGDALDAETVLERINADGAVVKRRGVRFGIVGRRD
jgi:hypothetical protein